MSIFSSNKPKIAIIIDIGSSSVGAAAVLLSSTNKPKVFYSTREEMTFQENFIFERFASSMIKTLENVLKDISAVKLPPHSEKVFSCFLASPWYASQTMILEKKFNTPVIVDEKMLNELQKKEVEGFKVQEIEKIGRDAVILETILMRTKLNGYETSDPFGKKAQEIELAIYASISSERIIKTISDRIKKVFHMSSPRFYSFSLASFMAIRDMFHEKSFLFMDISGEASDLSVVRDNTLQETITFPIGKISIIRKIASEVPSTFQEAASFFHMAKDDAFEESTGKKIKKAMAAVGKDWKMAFQSALSSASIEQPFLRDIFITADNDLSDWFIKNFHDQENDPLSFAGNVFVVRYLNGPFLSSFCNSEASVERDSFLMIESLFLNRVT